MPRIGLRVFTPILLFLLLAGCAPSQPSTNTDAVLPDPPAPVKRISVGVQTDFHAVATRLVRTGRGVGPGVAEIEQLVHAGLTQTDHTGTLQGALAEAVPTANGLWKVFPDGRMETTWRIRDGARWQDGTPFTAEDLVFSATVAQDAQLPLMRNPTLSLVERVLALDARTLVLEWKQPFIDADTIFAANGGVQHLPLPKHLLEEAYRDNKPGFEALPYWAAEFVGLGPYRIQEWVLGSFPLMLRANETFVLGRPKIDLIEVRAYPDPNILQAALLAEAVDFPLGTSRSTSFDLALDLQQRWRGTVHFSPGNVVMLRPQLLNSVPPVVADAGTTTGAPCCREPIARRWPTHSMGAGAR